jgi:hypothetical protein
MPVRHATKELFYGFPDWAIADWCCVSLQTARHWKAGIRAPGPAATKLFMLHRDGRILTSEWDGWGILKGKLCNPEGNELTQGQLRAYPFVYALAVEYGKTNSRARDTLYRLASYDQPGQKRKAGAVRQSAQSDDGEHPATAKARAATAC